MRPCLYSRHFNDLTGEKSDSAAIRTSQKLIASWPVSRVLYGSGEPERGSHSSGTALARCLTQPTRMTDPETGRKAFADRVIPIRFCSRWGLPCHIRCRRCGGLLPHPFTLTCHDRRFAFCGTFPEVALAGRYPAPCFRGARTFLTLPPFGIGKARLPGQLAGAPLNEEARKCQRNMGDRPNGNKVRNPWRSPGP